MTNHLRSRRFIIASLPLVFFACGGGGPDPGRDNFPRGTCDRTEARPGETVRCQVANFEDDCTCFVGDRPVTCSLVSSGELEILIPTQFGPSQISFACGAGERHVIENRFVVLPKPMDDNTREVQDGSGATAPAAPNAPDPEVITTPDPPDSSPSASGPEEGDDAPETSEETGSSELHVEVRARSRSEERLGLTTIEVTVKSDSPLRSLYLYSDGFNRLPEDRPRDDGTRGAGQPRQRRPEIGIPATARRSWTVGDSEDAPVRDRVPSNCGRIEDDLLGVRHLLVAPNGNQLNEGSPLFNRWANALASARECDGDNCDGYVTPADENRRPPTCRIDLIDSEGRFMKGEFELHTRVLAENSVFTLVAETEDGRKVSASTDETPTPPVARFRSVDVTIDGALPTVRIYAEYEGALYQAIPPSGCEILPSDFEPSGSGLLSARCPLQVRLELPLSVRGIGYRAGHRNSDRKVYTIEGQAPTVELSEIRFRNLSGNELACGLNSNPSSWWQSCNFKGTLELLASVQRTWTITGPDGVVTEVQTPWFQSVRIEPLTQPGGGTSCGPAQEFSGSDTARVTGHLYMTPSRGFERSHTCFRYQATVVDFDGRTYRSEEMRRGYAPEMSVPGFDYERDFVGTSNRIHHPGTFEELAQDLCQYDGSMDDDGGCKLFHPHPMKLSATARNCATVVKDCERGNSAPVTPLNDFEPNGLYKVEVITLDEEQRTQGNTCMVSCVPFDPDMPSPPEAVSYDACWPGGCFTF